VYGEFYGFRSEPFHVTPDASLVYLSEQHREAIGVMEYGLRERKGFIVLTGEVGVGKTTVLRHSLRRLDPDAAAIVYVVQPALSPRQLMALVWQELAEDPDTTNVPWIGDMGEVIRRLLFRLKELHDDGKIIVIVIDEAQTMPVETLESLRLLSNLETDKQKFVQIVLAGQPELEDKLERHELRQLNQRIAVRARLRELDRAESLAYVAYRLRMAAGRAVEPFDKGALRYIVGAAGGNPRRLNIFCDNALINGLGHRATTVTRRIAAEAIEPHLGDRRSGAFPLPFGLALPTRGPAFAALLVMALGVAFALGTQLVPAEPSRSPAFHASAPEDLRADNAGAAGDTAYTAAPAPAPSRSIAANWTARAGETLPQICTKAYGICTHRMIQALTAANPAIDPVNIAEGDTVALPIIENLKPVAR
jgi:type II secretory pathway predicted ATPase ExeA